jgi:hypothetical protein
LDTSQLTSALDAMSAKLVQVSSPKIVVNFEPVVQSIAHLKDHLTKIAVFQQKLIEEAKNTSSSEQSSEWVFYVNRDSRGFIESVTANKIQ